MAVIVPVGARMLAAMVEEADIVVLALQRPDLALDEFVELGQVRRDIGGNVEIHRGRSSGKRSFTGDLRASLAAVP
ncbi:MAG: hypothetical protein EPO50_28355 [Reyranella sp.]|nr:MAG: hypothetical protein EPO50_28355 [Reyranella sp.]